MAKKSDAKRSSRRADEVAAFQQWLNNLGLPVTPSVHVNGHQYPNTSILTVEFGKHRRGEMLSPAVANEFYTRLRDTARAIMGRDVNIRLEEDGREGVHWAKLG